MGINPEIICPSCKSSVAADAFFCPVCGKQLKDKPPEITLLKQITAYLVSLFLPPLGLWYVWKYYRAGDYASKRIAIICLILTLVSMIFTLWYTVEIVNSINQSIGQINNLNF